MMAEEASAEKQAFLSGKQTFLSRLWEMRGELAESTLLDKLRTKSWDRFLALGLPDRKHEVFRYIPLHKLYSRTAQVAAVLEEMPSLPLIEECPQSTLVFLNGSFRPDLSKTYALPKRVVVLRLSEAMKTYGSFITNQWNQGIVDEQDPFAALNGALHSDGLFLYIPPKTVCDVPIHLLQVTTSAEEAWVIPRMHIFVGSQAEVSFHVTHHSQGMNGSILNSVIEIAVEEGAHVRFSQSAIDLPEAVWLMEALRANLKRDSTFSSTVATNGTEMARFDYKAALSGENSEVLLNGVWKVGQKREAHTHVLVDHRAPHCHSDQLFKGVLIGSSRSSFEGKIYVRQEAQKTEAYQLNQNLVLSDQAIAYSKPNLEIFADDVKASHGSTIGQIEAEELFYLRTRGFSLEEATRLLVNSFCREVVEKIEAPSIRSQIRQAFKLNEEVN